MAAQRFRAPKTQLNFPKQLRPRGARLRGGDPYEREQFVARVSHPKGLLAERTSKREALRRDFKRGGRAKYGLSGRMRQPQKKQN